MNRQEFWDLIEASRAQGPDGADAEAVAAGAVARLAVLPAERIVAAAQPLWDLMAESYRGDLWAAAYLINGGASDDGFEYFRGWLIAQGRAVFERAVADPDSLAELSTVRTAAADCEDLECESILGIAWDAHHRATGEGLPSDAFTIRYPKIDFGWDFDDHAAMRHRLPMLAELCLDDGE